MYNSKEVQQTPADNNYKACNSDVIINYGDIIWKAQL